MTSGAPDLSAIAQGAKVDVLERVSHRFPSLLVDAVVEHEPGKRIVAFKNVTVNEDFFQGHFPSKPLMPAVLMIEALAQAAAVLLLDSSTSLGTGDFSNTDALSVQLRGVDGAKFRKHVRSRRSAQADRDPRRRSRPARESAVRPPRSTARPWSKPSCCSR